MTSLKLKSNIGMTIIILFAITLISGIILHLKKHGLLIEPRDLIKIIHWVCGFAMSVFTIVHWKQFNKMLSALKNKVKWFYVSTSILKTIFLLTLVTGARKLLSPVKIPHLGLWHYGLGIAMSILIIVHLFRGIPAWIRLRKACK